MSPFKTRWTFLKGYVLLNFELTNNGYFALDFIVSKAVSVFYVPSNRVQRAKQAVMLSTTEKKANKKFLKQVEVWKITSTTGSLLPPSWTKAKMKANFSFMDSVLSYQTLIITHLPFINANSTFQSKVLWYNLFELIDIYWYKVKQFGYSTIHPLILLKHITWLRNVSNMYYRN